MKHELPTAPNSAPAPAEKIPFAWWYPVLAGAFTGMLMRSLLFVGKPGGRYSAMLGAFIYLVPVVCGAVTVYLAERERRRSWWYYLWAPWLSTALLVLGTLLIYIEGLICAAVIVPMFAVMGSVGGLAMGIACRLTRRPSRSLYGLAALPLVLGAVEPEWPNPEQLSATSRTVFIAAPAEQIWQQLNDVRDVQPHEMRDAWAHRIGVPLPLSGVTRSTPQGLVREMRWQKNVHFEGVITEWEPAHRLRWRYRFGPDSFPSGALDDHVLIGGHYFDLRDTAFTLTPQDGGTLLRIDVAWRVSTRFNWYANRVAQLLLGNFSEHVLQLYKARSEAARG